MRRFLAGAFLAAFFVALRFFAGAFFAAFLAVLRFFAGAFLAAFLRFFAAMIFSLFRYCYLRFGFNSLFSVELEVNFIAIEAGTWTGAPVCGLRPVRALRLDVLNEPKPGHATFSPFLAEATTSSKNEPIVRSASAFDTPAF